MAALSPRQTRGRRPPVGGLAADVVTYRGEKVGTYKPDFIVDDKVIVEVKAVEFLPAKFGSQLTYYLKGTEYKVGLLVNFGAKKLDIRRRVYEKEYRPGVLQR